MVRTLVTVGVILGVTTAVLAQADAVATRKQLMGSIASQAWGAFPKMVKGEQPYDQAKVDAGFTQMIDAAGKLSAQFPEGTQDAEREGSRYVASPKIWENKADFDARLAKFAKDLADAKPKVTSLDNLKQEMPGLLKNCDGCHEAYRIRK